MSIKGLACIKKLINIRYERKFPGSDLRDMETMKHVAKTIGLATPGRLDKEKNMATVKTVRLGSPMGIHAAGGRGVCFCLCP